jgi:hypothetical protein
MQYSQEDHLNLFLNEELNQQIKALLVNVYLQPLSKNLEDVRGKLNVSSIYTRIFFIFRNFFCQDLFAENQKSITNGLSLQCINIKILGTSRRRLQRKQKICRKFIGASDKDFTQ